MRERGSSIQGMLRGSHVAAVAIALLFFWSVDSAYQALWNPIFLSGKFLFEVIKLWQVPYLPPYRKAISSMVWSVPFGLAGCLIALAMAWFLSRWVYGVGPLRGLRQAGNKFGEGRING
jgi:hypothetical protein